MTIGWEPENRVEKRLSIATLTRLSPNWQSIRAGRGLTASANTERRVQRDYVDRDDDPEERRKAVLNLTEAGKQQLYQTRAQTRAYISELLNDLTEEQVAQIYESLNLLKHIFEDTALDSLED